MSDYFEKELTENIKQIEIWGYSVTPWHGIATKLNEMGYPIIEYKNGICGSAYIIYNEPTLLNGYIFTMNGNEIFVHTDWSIQFKLALIEKIMHEIGKSIYDYEMYQYLEANIKEAKCFCKANGYKVNGKQIDNIMFIRIY